MQVLRQPYESIMAMPCGRRRRLCEEKEHLDRVQSKKKPPTKRR